MLKKVVDLLDARERVRGLLVLGLMIVMACLEVAGVASVMPFLAVLGSPEIVQTNAVLSALYDGLGFASVDGFLFALGLAAFVLILFSALFRMGTHWVMNRYVEMRRHSISRRLLETYLRQPYAYFLDRHSSDMAKTILSEVDQLTTTILRPGIKMLAYSVVVVAIVVLLVIVNPWIALATGLVFGGSYLLVYLVVRGILGRLGERRRLANAARFKAAAEALAGIKQIRLLGREHAYLDQFSDPSLRHASYQATKETASFVPRFLIEAVAFGGIIALSLVLLAAYGGVGSDALGRALPVLGVYALAGYRMLFAAQQVYQGMAQMRFGAAALNGVHEDLCQRERLAGISRRTAEPMVPREAVALEHIVYSYPHAAEPALQDIDLRIPVGSSIGLVGSTGAGKTTLVDVILGLLQPQQGCITVDGEPVTDARLRAWQQALGYVPQDIFLTDTSVAENIALGVPLAEIDREQVVRCARMARIDAFVEQELTDGYDTVVGERGVRLSGGQRQRLGIARALYHDPAVLVFDEATSALDTVTEQAVMEAIQALSGRKTVILIAHRLSTVRRCDQIALLEQGRIAARDSYESLRQDSSAFRAMAARAGE